MAVLLDIIVLNLWEQEQGAQGVVDFYPCYVISDNTNMNEKSDSRDAFHFPDFSSSALI